MHSCSQSQRGVANGVVGSEAGLRSGGNFACGCSILGPKLCTSPSTYPEPGKKTGPENARNIAKTIGQLDGLFEDSSAMCDIGRSRLW